MKLSSIIARFWIHQLKRKPHPNNFYLMAALIILNKFNWFRVLFASTSCPALGSVNAPKSAHSTWPVYVASASAGSYAHIHMYVHRTVLIRDRILNSSISKQMQIFNWTHLKIDFDVAFETVRSIWHWYDKYMKL